MKKGILTRMGDGQRVEISPAQVKQDLLAGTKDAADKGRIPELTSAELEQLFEIIADRNQVVSLEPDERIVLPDNLSTIRATEDEVAGGGVGMPMSRLLAVLVAERVMAADSAMMEATACINVREVKAEIDVERQAYETTSLLTTIPLFYLVAPALLWYIRPNGPYDNPADLLPQGKIQESRDASEKAAEHLMNDLIFIGQSLNSVGCDCFDISTTGGGGDPEFYAALKAIQKLKEVAPDMAVDLSMSGEFIIGVHGQITFNGQRLAGMFPHQQAKVAEAAGVNIFSPMINTNCSKSFPWNIARAVTFVKQTVAESNIPIHAFVAMGIGGAPMRPIPPIDCITRVAKAMVQIGKVDGVEPGTGDYYGPIAQVLSAGMGGVRTAGDLVMWMQLTRKMRLAQAKQYVAEKLKVSPIDLVDEYVMREIRHELGIGTITSVPGGAKGIAAKCRIAELLGIEINSVNKFKQKAGLVVPAL